MDCPLHECDGSGFVVDTEARTTRPCRCRPERIAKAKGRRLSSVIPKKFHGAHFDRAPIVNMTPHVVADVRAYADDIDGNIERGRGLWLYGDVGTGKTTLAMAVCRIALDRGHSVAIYSLPKLLWALRTTFDDNAEMSYVQLMDALTSVDLLHIDDVGSSTQNEWVLEQLYSLVNGRYEEEKAISLTTNLDPDELSEQITPRTASRLVEMCGDPMALTGPDERRQHHVPATIAGYSGFPS